MSGTVHGKLEVNPLATFNRLESEVRGYCRSFPTMFTRASGAFLFDHRGRRYLDFLSGAGTLNYGHNNPALREKMISYMQSDGLVHGLDMATSAKRRFLETFDSVILKPRGMRYKYQFTGPTGANAVEASLKLARKYTGRSNVIAFTNGFHGVTLGALATTANAHFREAAGVPLSSSTFMPYDGYLGNDVNSLDYLERALRDKSSGLGKPAAVILETVQGEGGVNVAGAAWLQRLSLLCREFGALLILDDIQVGCGRTGKFFSFEDAGIQPDIITLSKSLSGFGMPMALVLMKPELDVWEPSEHNGTFRGNNLAFVTAREAVLLYWQDGAFAAETLQKGETVRERLQQICDAFPAVCKEVRGRGLIQGLVCESSGVASEIAGGGFERGLIIETCGGGEVLKVLPPLTIDSDVLSEGLDILEQSVAAASAKCQMPLHKRTREAYLCDHTFD